MLVYEVTSWSFIPQLGTLSLVGKLPLPAGCFSWALSWGGPVGSIGRRLECWRKKHFWVFLPFFLYLCGIYGIMCLLSDFTILGKPLVSPASTRTAETLGFSNSFLSLLPLAFRWLQIFLFLTPGCLSGPALHLHPCIKLPLFWILRKVSLFLIGSRLT